MPTRGPAHDRPASGVCHTCGSRGRAARPHHGRTRNADLPDHVVRVRGRRSRRFAVRAANIRQHLYAHWESDQRGAGRTRGGTRGRDRRPCGRLRARRAGDRDAHPDAPGRRVCCGEKLYGGSINQFNHAFKNFGWQVVWADPDDISTFERAVSPKTRAIFIESIANPGGVITDIEAVAAIAKRAGVPLIVDNTLATPYLCKPIDYGADIVVHSLTKFLGGTATRSAG